MISSTAEQIWIDIHCHLFNAHDLPVVDFVRETRSSWEAWLADITTRGAPTVDDDLRLIDALMRGEHPTIPDGAFPSSPGFQGPIAGLFRMRHAATRSRVTSLRLLDSICSETDVEQLQPSVRNLLTPDDSLAPVSLYVPLCVDMGPRIDRDSRRASPLRQLEVMERLSAASMFEGVIPALHGIVLPMVGFHPERPPSDLRSNLKRATEAVCRGLAIGVKLYPPMGFRPTGNEPDVQVVLDHLFEMAAEYQVPIVAHCSPANAIPGADGYAHPWNWHPVLERHGDLRLCLAHSGGLDAPSWVTAAARLATRYPNVYCDVSNHDLVRRRTEMEKLFDDLAHDSDTAGFPSKTVFGSDYWFLLERPGYIDFLADYANFFRTKYGHLYERFSGSNARSFLGFDDPDNQNTRRVLDRIQTLEAANPGKVVKQVVGRLVAGA